MTREEAIEWLDYMDTFVSEDREAIEMAIEALKQQEQKTGKWIITDTYNNQIWRCNCSACGKDPQYFISGTEDWWINKLPNFCPNCGADMREEEDG